VGPFSIQPRHLERIRVQFPGLEVVNASGREDFLQKLPEADWVMTWFFRPEWYERAPRLKAVFTPAAGKDWVIPDPSGRVTSYYGRFHGRIMRETLLAMILHFNRRIDATAENQKNRKWDVNAYDRCSSLFRQDVVIVGYGSIGSQMAQLLKAFGARITGVKRNTAGFESDPYADRVVTFDLLDEILPTADHVVFILPGGKGTDGIFERRHFDLMKPGSHLFNLGRGNCYDEDDLVRALREGPLAGAGLDVFREEPLPESSVLWELPNVLIMPHSSAVAVEYLDLYLDEWIETARGLKEGLK
jgi:phosphoglycerate dehydrogenase-like enzyme